MNWRGQGFPEILLRKLRNSLLRCRKIRISDFSARKRLMVTSACLFVSVSSASAADASDYLLYSKGPVLLRPSVGVSESFNDNLFSQPDGQSDFITTISPGLNIQFGRLAKNYVALDYTFNRHFYAKRSDLDAGEHSFELRSRLQGERLVLTGSDSIQLLSSPIGIISEYRTVFQTVQPGPTPGGGAVPPVPGAETPGSVRGPEVIGAIADRNIERRTFSDNYSLGYAISEKTAVYLQGAHSTSDYEEGISLYDINTLRGTAGFAFQAFPKTAFFGEAYYGQSATTPNFPAPKNAHAEILGGFVGARGEFTAKLSGSVKAGYEVRKFSDNTPAPSSPVVDISLTYRPTEKGVLSASFARVHDLSIQYGNESYTAEVVSLQWDQILGPSYKWRATWGGRFGAFDYQAPAGEVERHYDQYSAYFRLAYQIQLWLSANLGYSWESVRPGAGAGSNYQINRATLSVAIGY